MPRKLTEEERIAKERRAKERARKKKKEADHQTSLAMVPRIREMFDQTSDWLIMSRYGKFAARIFSGVYSPRMMEGIQRMVNEAARVTDTENHYCRWLFVSPSRERLKIVERERETGKFVRLLYDGINGTVVADFDQGADTFAKLCMAGGMGQREVDQLLYDRSRGRLDDDAAKAPGRKTA